LNNIYDNIVRSERAHARRGRIGQLPHGGILRGAQVQEGYATLRQAIIRGQLSPGSRLLETELAQTLKLSRSSVRTVLHRLQHEGFVEASGGPRTRMTVRPLTQEDFWELSEIVGELEGLAAQRVARLATEARHRAAKELRERNRKLGAAVRTAPRDHIGVFQLDDAFHLKLVDLAGNERLIALLHGVKPQLQRYEGVYFSMAERAAQSVREHEAVIVAIEAGDPRAAHDAVWSNLMNAAKQLVRHIERFGERGTFSRPSRR
jgi:DNA-binding GntR family transcriptional regulator